MQILQCHCFFFQEKSDVLGQIDPSKAMSSALEGATNFHSILEAGNISHGAFGAVMDKIMEGLDTDNESVGEYLNYLFENPEAVAAFHESGDLYNDMVNQGYDGSMNDFVSDMASHTAASLGEGRGSGHAPAFHGDGYDQGMEIG